VQIFSKTSDLSESHISKARRAQDCKGNVLRMVRTFLAYTQFALAVHIVLPSVAGL
jgi:hypothetical protein